ncbi:hypothetical protein E4099_25210 [Streptomyces palmae]|uniref:Uncharacterized protein n=1 Tax=Streptomyces palmae TaxID=1701085 RepID=A0A4Z0GGU1_9ACTN|nr:hypothetical protein E4099_25210 [Streptomyces palmae]
MAFVFLGMPELASAALWLPEVAAAARWMPGRAPAMGSVRSLAPTARWVPGGRSPLAGRTILICGSHTNCAACGRRPGGGGGCGIRARPAVTGAGGGSALSTAGACGGRVRPGCP